ncbi:MAG: hypothetical protein AB1467_00450 [Candidatus Diapherotrites archaeon]
MNSKGMIFSLDAMFAVIIIMAGTILFAIQYNSEEAKSQNLRYLVQDVQGRAMVAAYFDWNASNVGLYDTNAFFVGKTYAYCYSLFNADVNAPLGQNPLIEKKYCGGR